MLIQVWTARLAFAFVIGLEISAIPFSEPSLRVLSRAARRLSMAFAAAFTLAKRPESLFRQRGGAPSTSGQDGVLTFGRHGVA